MKTDGRLVIRKIASAPPFLRIMGLNVARGGRKILAAVNATAESGEIITITGANGAGKTTLLLALAGGIPAESGELECGEHGLTLVPDHGGVIPLLTVREQLVLASILAGESDGTAAERAEIIIDLIGMRGKESIKAGELSSGQKKRLGIGICLTRNADIYLFDEPGNGLDIQAGELLSAVLGTLRSRGKILLVATHPLLLIERIADRQWNIESGNLAELAAEAPARHSAGAPAAVAAVSAGRAAAAGEFLPWIR